MKRYIAVMALMIMAAIAIMFTIITVNADAEQVEQADHFPDNTKMVDKVSYEDPHESEKIEAALDWHYIDGCELTAYCSCAECCGKDNGITATGTQAQQGVTIAVDPDVIPLGAWVEIDGHLFRAEDVGGGVNGNHIDVYYDSHEMASAFGVKTRDVRWYGGLGE